MPMTRDEAIAAAQSAAWHANGLADEAARAARSGDPNKNSQTQRLAAAGTTWASASRAYSALAAVLPVNEEETADA